MDVGRTFEYLPMLVLIIAMFIMPRLPVDIQRIMQPTVMVLSIALIFVTDAFARVLAAEYIYIEAACRPSNQKLHLFVKDLETTENEDGINTTKLELGIPVKHKFYQVMRYLVIQHKFLWEKRMILTPAKANYHGYLVKHPKTAKITLYEQATSDIDHLNPIPTFLLKEAPGDYYLSTETLAPTVLANGGFQLNELLLKNEKLMREINEHKRSSLDWHQRAVRLEEVVDQLKNELMAVLHSKADFKGTVIEYMLTIREAQLNITNALKTMRKPRITITKMVVALACVVGFFLTVWLVPDVLVWVQMNSGLVIVLAALGAVTAYYISTKKK